jgi:hypothetical protein
MDLSRWEQIIAEKQDVLKAKIIQEAKSGEMPPLQYLALHWNAKLSAGGVHTQVDAKPLRPASAILRGAPQYLRSIVPAATRWR